MPDETMFNDIRVTAWLIATSINTLLTRSIINAALRYNGFVDGFGAWCDEMIQGDMAEYHDVGNGIFEHHIRVFGVRLLSLFVVLNPREMDKVYLDPHRSQFTLPGVMAACPGNDTFFDRALTGDFAADKKTFKNVLNHGHQILKQNLSAMLLEQFPELDSASSRAEIKSWDGSDTDEYEKVSSCDASAENDVSELIEPLFSEWFTSDVHTIVRRLIFKTLAQTFLGLNSETSQNLLDTHFEEVTQLLDRFDQMWQNPELMRPLEMRTILRRLDVLSTEFHKVRGPAPLLDDFAENHGRSLNMMALFFVSANLIRAVAHAIIMGCSNFDYLTSKIKAERGTAAYYKNLSRLILIDAFGDARIFRLNSWNREVTIIPNGNLNRQLLDTESFLKSDDVREPYLFGRGRPCPGAAAVYTVLETVLKFFNERNYVFVPAEDTLDPYCQFHKNNHIHAKGRGQSIPSVRGRWLTAADAAKVTELMNSSNVVLGHFN